MKKTLTVLYSTLCLLQSTLLFVIPTLGGISTAFAQGSADSVRITHTQEAGTLEKQEFVSATDYIFKTQEETKWLLKANYTGKLTGRSITGDLEYTLEMGGEIKLTPSFSINALIGYNHKEEEAIRGFLYGQLEPRWYYNMARRISKGQSANNFSGSYLAAKVIRFQNRTPNREGETLVTPQDRFMLSYGKQYRMFTHGFFDFSINAGWQRDNRHTPVYAYDNAKKQYELIDSQISPQNGFVASSEIRLGLVLSKLRTKTSVPACDIFRCFEEENQLFKMDMTKLFHITPNNINISLSTAYERKFRQSAWSLNQELRIDYDYHYNHIVFSANSSSTEKSNGFTVRYVIQPRYYYSLNKRISRGKSANNLSGTYVALHNVNTLYHTFLHLSAENAHLRTRLVPALGAVWGIQKRLFTHGFVDANFGIVRKLNERFHDFIIPGVAPVLDIKVGFAL